MDPRQKTTPEPGAPVLGPELLLNPGFETASRARPTYWSSIGEPVYDTGGKKAHEGRSAVLARTSSGYSQVVQIRAGRRYLLSNYSRCERQDASVRLQVNWLEAHGKMLSPTIAVREASTAYTHQILWLEAPLNAGVAVVYVASHEEAACWFDDFSFREVYADR